MAWLDDLVGQAHGALLSDVGREAREYLASRGLTDEDIELHHLGYADPTLTIAACTSDFDKWREKYYYNRIVFPLRSVLGNVIGIQTRCVDEKRYMQFWAYPTEIFPYLFGLSTALPAIWATRQVVIVEGIFDQIAASRVAPNTVATMTAKASMACGRFFRRYVKRVVALLDMDEPGREGAEKLKRFAPPEYSVYVPVYSEHDPGDMLKNGKLEELRRVLQYAGDVL